MVDFVGVGRVFGRVFEWVFGRSIGVAFDDGMAFDDRILGEVVGGYCPVGYIQQVSLRRTSCCLLQ